MLAPKRLKVLLPLLFACLLTGAFVVLLLRQIWQLADEPALGVAAAPPKEELPRPGLKVPASRIPSDSPTVPQPYAPRERPYHAGSEFFRWNLADYPKGWDPALARKIHDFFEAMEIDFRDPDHKQLAELDKMRQELDAYLASLGPEAVPTLAAILNAESDFVDRRFLLRALGNLGPRSEEATWVLRDFFMARHEDPANRSEMGYVIDAMGKLQNDTSFEVLHHMIEEGADSRRPIRAYRDKLIEALGDHPRREEAIDTFVDSLARDAAFPTRNKAAQALGKVRSPDTLGDLYNAFQRERVWYAKQTILGTIGKIGNPNSIPFLEEQARTAQESGVRLSAARAILRIGEQRPSTTQYAEQVVKELVRSEPEPLVRQQIERWLNEGR
jgi:HEAT repeat protein